MCNILETRTLIYNLRSQTDVVRDCVNTRSYGLYSLSCFVPKICDMIPLEIKDINSLQKLKTEIKNGLWNLLMLALSAIYIQNLGFNGCSYVFRSIKEINMLRNEINRLLSKGM